MRRVQYWVQTSLEDQLLEEERSWEPSHELGTGKSQPTDTNFNHSDHLDLVFEEEHCTGLGIEEQERASTVPSQ